ncbi:MAG: hypothetical protein EBY62_05545, partial [Cellvibrionales bacterium]|nr:hypothetical protein [Cellvibrionales bacterium]
MSVVKRISNALAAVAVLPAVALGDNQVNMSPGVTSIGAEIYDLHMLIMIICVPQEEIYNTDQKGEHYLLEVDEPLVIPVNTKVRFLVTANDVIHSWWVPEIAVKRDAIPGFINETWTKVPEEGIYRGQCTELCGAYHGFMPVVVHAVSREEFDAWMGSKRADKAAQVAASAVDLSLDELMSKGESVYNSQCLACHGAQGEGGVGKAIAGSAIALGDVGAHLDVGIKGVAGTAMQAYGSQ